MRPTGPATASALDGASTRLDDSRVAVLEPALWKKLGESADLGEFCKTWLVLQCGLIGDVAGGVVVAGPDTSGVPIAVQPEGFSPLSLAHTIRLAAEQRRGVARVDNPSTGPAGDG